MRLRGGARVDVLVWSGHSCPLPLTLLLPLILALSVVSLYRWYFLGRFRYREGPADSLTRPAP